MSKIQIFLKHYFPNLYRNIRNSLFPCVQLFRSRRTTDFKHKSLKAVSPLNTNFLIQLNPNNGFIDNHIFATGTYEPDILDVIKKHLPTDGVFIDIGGNIGWHTLFAASLLGDKGHVHTFEPLDQLREQLQISIEANSFNDRISLHDFGCSDKDEVKELHINHQNIGGSSVYDERNKDTIKINLKAADSVLFSVPQISLIKIDTEGYEVEVLRGLTATLKKKPTLIIEYSPSFWNEDRDIRSQEFFSILKNSGYEIYDLEDGYKKVKDSVSWIKNFKKLQTNFLCIAN